MGSTGTTASPVATSSASAVMLPTGERADKYFEFGSYAKSYTVEKFAEDSRTVDTYRGIDFERSGDRYEKAGREYNAARKRWSKQISFYNRKGQ